MKKLEIIDETAEFYMEDVSRRAMNSTGGCNYVTQDGRCCAVGRCMLDPPKPDSDAAKKYASDFDDLDSLLKPEYRGHSIQFWGQLQDWHDSSAYWNDEGLIKAGQRALEELRELWK